MDISPLTQALLWNMRMVRSVLIFSPVHPVCFPPLWQFISKPLKTWLSLETRRVIGLNANLQGKTKQAKLTTIVVSHCLFSNCFIRRLGSCKTWQSTWAAPGALAARSLLKLPCKELGGTALLKPPAVAEDAAASMSPCWLCWELPSCSQADDECCLPGFRLWGQGLLWIVSKDVVMPRQQQSS